MFRVSIAILCVTLSLAAWQAAPGAEPLPPAVRWIPQNALIVVELSDPEALLDLAFDQAHQRGLVERAVGVHGRNEGGDGTAQGGGGHIVFLSVVRRSARGPGW